MQCRIGVAGAILIALSCSSAAYALPEANSGVKAYQIENTRVVEIRSELLKRTYDIYIKLPPSYAASPSRRYPVVFLNDAVYSFPLACSLTRQLMNAGRIEEVIVVGISYSKGDDPDLSRTRDYTPSNSPDERIGHSPEAKRASGEAPRYLRFVTDEVIPKIAATYRINVAKKTYAGHSFGGLFGAYVVVTAPATFENYLISDPSLWYDNEVIFKLASRVAAPARSMNVLVINANPDIAQRGTDKAAGALSDMARSGERLSEGLKQRYGEGGRIAWRAFDGELHETIFPIALSHALLRFHGK